MSSAASRPARGARRSTREPSANGSTSRRSISVDPIIAQQSIDLQEQEDEADPDDSTGSNSRRKNRPEINRRVPHQSFAYGAPNDGRQRQSIGGRSGSVSGRDVEASTSLTPSPHKPAAELHPNADAEEVEHQPPQQPAVQPPANSAASRYAALKAKKQQTAAAAAAAAATTTTTTTTNTARSTTTIETSDEEVDAHGKSRKSSVPPPARAAASTARSRQGGQLNSFFVRAPASNASQSMSPGPDDNRATSSQQRLVMPSSLLRGAQKQPHDHIPPLLLSPRRRGAPMAANPFNDSSEAGDSISHSYASEEAFVQRNGSASNAARETTPPARPPGWFEKISPWRDRVRTGEIPVNGKQAAQDDEDEEEADDANASTRTARRRPRTSQGDRDQTYRPPKNFELDDDDESSSDGGKRPRKKSGRRSAGDHSARGGRDDNKIWKATKRRKGRRSGGTGADAGDDSAEGEGDEEADTLLDGDDDGAFVDGLLSSEEPLRRKAPRKSKALQASSPPSALGKQIGMGALVLLVAYLCFSGSNSLEGAVVPGSDQKAGLLSNIPLVGRLVSSRTQEPVFRAPNVPPSDLEAFVDRLLSLESIVGSLSTTSSSLLASRDKMAKQLAMLEMSDQEFAKMLAKVEGREAADRDQLGGRVKALEEVGKRLRQQMEQLEAQQQRQESHTDKSLKEQRRILDEQVKALQGDVKKNEEEIAKVLTSAVAAERIATEAKDALRPLLEMNLPAQLPVKIDRRSGKPVIEGWFYEALKGMLGGAAAAEGGAPATVSHFDWDTFRSVNDASLRALIAEQASGVFSAQRTQHALLSRSDFLEVLSRELDAMKSVLEKKFNENAHGIQNDILAKVRSQQAMYEESGSWKGGSDGDRSRGKRAGASRPSSLPLVEEVSLSQVQTKDGSDATGAVLTLIDAALEAYSADKLNRADFAAYSAGGRVVPSMTSPTFEYSLGGGGSSRGGLMSWVVPWKGATSVEKFRGRSPAHALHHDNQPGMCWPFRGSYGQLGIQLARRVIVSDITIDHAPYSLLFGDEDGGGIDSAPREVTVSGYIERMEDRVRLKEWQAAQRVDGEMEEEEGEEDIHPNPPPNHIHLASFTYQGPGPHTRPTQTFAVSAEARALRIPVMLVQVRVHSNHGNERFTCLYRVRVHGDEVQW